MAETSAREQGMREDSDGACQPLLGDSAGRKGTYLVLLVYCGLGALLMADYVWGIATLESWQLRQRRIGALYNSPVHPGKHLLHGDLLKLASVLLVSSGQNVPHSLGPVGSHVEAKSQLASIYILCEYGLGRSGILSCVGPYARGRAHAAQKCGEPHLWLFRSLLLY